MISTPRPQRSMFEADAEGMRELHSGKPKFTIIRELVANAFDEPVKEVGLWMKYADGIATIVVEDDAPEGFKDLRDTYTINRPCYKRKDPTLRGRFNEGEKVAICMAEQAEIQTTKGTVKFFMRPKPSRRVHSEVKTLRGSTVTVAIKMSERQLREALEYVNVLIPPGTLQFSLNGVLVVPPVYVRTFAATLPTEYLQGDAMVRTARKTDVSLYQPVNGKVYLYEMGIPVCEIDCLYSVNIGQRIPMGRDRDAVSETYLQDVYAEVLKQSYAELPEDKAADTWVNVALADDRLKDKNDHAAHRAVETIVENRYGDKVCVASPGDPRSIDDAICKDYNVVHGRELPSDIWDTIRKHGAIPSSTKLFGRGVGEYCNPVEPNEDMNNVAILAQRIAKEALDIWPDVEFVKSDATDGAWYGSRKLTFNVEQLGEAWFRPPLNPEHIALIIHELAHEGGEHHTEGYYKTLAMAGARLVMKALKEPAFFGGCSR